MGDTQIAQGELSKYDYILHKFIVKYFSRNMYVFLSIHYFIYIV